MDVRRREFADDVIRIIRDICAVVFNISTDERLTCALGVTYEQLEVVIRKIIDALPEHVFTRAYPQAVEDLKNICAREFIFFQVQEKWDDPRYQEDLSRFINVFSRDMQERIEIYKGCKSKMREEK